MSRSIEVSTNERLFLLESIKQGIRLDSRKLDQIRKPEIYISPDEYGYVEIQWGSPSSKVAVRVSSFVDKPYEDRPFEGIFNINCEISSMALAKFDNYKNSNEEVIVSRVIEKAIKRSSSLDLENLCIVAGEKVWNIQVDLNFLNFDGNFIDIGCFAVILALQHYKKPDVSIIEEQIVVHDMNERQPVSLSILHVPICLTYSFYNLIDKESIIKGDGNEDGEDIKWLIDANLKEELVRDGSIVITLNKNRELIQLSKNGGVPLDAKLLLDLAFGSVKIVDELTQLMKDVLQKDEAERYIRNDMKLLEVGAKR